MKKFLQIVIVSALLVQANMLSAQTVPNGGMEVWTPGFGYEDPAGWATFNLLSLQGEPISVFKSTDKYSGTYAARIKTIALISNPAAGIIPDTVGIMFTGTLSFSEIIFGYPFEALPASIQFYYKYAPNGDDTSYVMAFLTKWNTNTQQRDTVGGVITTMFGATASYSQRQAPVDYDPNHAGVSPDTAIVFVSSSGNIGPKEGSQLYIDDISFIGGDVGIVKVGQEVKVSVYPNPATDKLVISTPSANASIVHVYDMTGKIAGRYNLMNSKATIDASAYSEGVYLYRIMDNSMKVLNSGKFNIVK
jgi:hypothetical protein